MAPQTSKALLLSAAPLPPPFILKDGTRVELLRLAFDEDSGHLIVMAQAWRSGAALFAKSGEEFRFQNPPLLTVDRQPDLSQVLREIVGDAVRITLSHR